MYCIGRANSIEIDKRTAIIIEYRLNEIIIEFLSVNDYLVCVPPHRIYNSNLFAFLLGSFEYAFKNLCRSCVAGLVQGITPTHAIPCHTIPYHTA